MHEQLDLGEVATRHRKGRASFRRQAEEIDPGRYGVERLEGDRLARAFIREHHYSGTFPAAIASYGLFRSEPFRTAALVGVVTFSVPVNPLAAGRYGAHGVEFCDLGRLVLLDSEPGNAESWAVSRAFAGLARDKRAADGRPRYGLCLSYSDPVPRLSADGRTSHRGHYGSVYQSLNARYLGRSTRKTLVLARDGTSLDARTVSKLRNDESGAAGAYEQMLRMGAPRIRPGESGRDYVMRAVAEGPFRRVSHRGNHAYGFGLGGHSRRHAVDRMIRTGLEYPKVTDAPIGWC